MILTKKKLVGSTCSLWLRSAYISSDDGGVAYIYSGVGGVYGGGYSYNCGVVPVCIIV